MRPRNVGATVSFASEYHTMAESAKKNAAGSKDAAVKERYLALFNALTELADILQDRQSH